MIEILVSLLISAFLLSGVVSIALTSRQTYQLKENISRIQENLRVASEVLRRTLSMTESLHPDSNASQIIAVFTGDVGVTNCLGNEVASGMVFNRFYVKNNTLYCGTAYPSKTGSEQPLVDGITAMTVQYGVDEKQQGQVDRYVEAPADWDQVVSVRLSLRLLPPSKGSYGPVILTVALRPRIFSRLR